ncbi:MAG: DUF2768 family protein [Calditerricola sp.]|nr:DUF2768 family protein [Calditerricola sp.]
MLDAVIAIALMLVANLTITKARQLPKGPVRVLLSTLAFALLPVTFLFVVRAQA